MRRKIDQLLNGIFEYEKKQLLLSTEQIEEEGSAGIPFGGSFIVTSPTDKRIRGFLYSSNPRVVFDPPSFYGSQVQISYQVDTNGLEPGGSTAGSFTICTDRGESVLPYRFTIREEKTGNSSEAASAAELAEIFRKDSQSAVRIFQSGDFLRALRADRPEEYLLLDALRSGSDPRQNLEEFLIGSHVKEPVEIRMDQTELVMAHPEKAIKCSIPLTMIGWGYLKIRFSSQERFLRFEKKSVTTDAFVGGVYRLEYIIDTNFLHAGRNYGRIQVSTCYQTLNLDITIESAKKEEEVNSLRVQRLMQKKLLGLYIDLRLKRIEMTSWIDRSVNVISSYRRAGGHSVYADLFLVQLYFADGKRMKANRLLQELEHTPERFVTQDQYAFYLYVTTFFEQDSAYVDQVEARIEQMFLLKRDSWVMQWILLYLQERFLRDDSAKLEAIATQVRYGCSSPIMYLEACQIFMKNPYLLRSLEGFEKRVLLFAVKEKLLNEELIYQIGNLAMQQPAFESKLFSILEACYETLPSDEILKAICTVLIAGDKKESEYFHWYALAVNAEIRITGLYEYYMETMDTVGIEKMPQIIRMYFSYNHSLNYRKKAAIYRDISDNRENVPQVYRSARPDIEHFIAEQLSLGRIDDNLAVLYERFLTRRILTRSMAENLVKLLFTFEVTCKNPKMRSVVVVHRNLRHEKEKPLTDGLAKIQIYTEDARIFLVDAEGKRYASTSLYMARRYLDSPLLMTFCKEMVPEHPGLVLYVCSNSESVDAQTLPFYKKAEREESFRTSWREQMRRRILSWYLEHPRQDDLYDYLHTIDFHEFVQADKKGLMTLLTQEGMYEEAFDLLERYGSEKLDISCLIRICSQSVLSGEYEENRVLLDYCYQCFSYGKYDDNILNYLLMYYDGPIEDMKRLWNTCIQYELDTMTLEEKILGLVLFTGSGTEGTERIFASYRQKLGRKKLARAYVNLKSYEYFVKNLPVNDLLFTYLEEDYRSGADLEDVCLLALLQHYAGLAERTPAQEEAAKALLTHYNALGIRFAFYQRFPRQLRLPCQLDDKVFLEYVADPSHSIILFYRLKGSETEWQQELMKNIFEGIFVREFILFEGETIECYIEDHSAETLVKKSGIRELTSSGANEYPRSRFAMLCEMSESAREGKEQELKEQLDNYFQTDYLTREIFTLV